MLDTRILGLLVLLGLTACGSAPSQPVTDASGSAVSGASKTGSTTEESAKKSGWHTDNLALARPRCGLLRTRVSLRSTASTPS